MIEVWNKIDLLETEGRDATLNQVERVDELYAVSALTGEGMEPLLAAIPDKLKDPRHEVTLHLPFADGRKRAWLFDAGIVTNDVMTEAGYDMTVFWTDLQKQRFGRL